jgi:DNA replication protein DnaC
MINTGTLSFDLHKSQQEKVRYINTLRGNFEGYNCTECLNKGYIAFLRGESEVVYRDCKCKAIRKSIKNINNSGIEQQIKSCKFANFKVIEAFQGLMKTKAEQYIKSYGWFIICGQSGCGKTHICTAIVGELINCGKSCIYMSYRDEITKLKQSINDGCEYQKRMDELKKVPVLYIDDFFKGKITEADINATFELLNYRYINRLQTIISSELMFDQIMDIDQAIAGRIKQQAGEFLIQINKDVNKNYRMK